MGFLVSSLAPTAAVLPFAGVSAPDGWLLCNGAAISRVTYASLFAAMGTAHGSGDGSTTFNLPDYRGRFLRGTANGQSTDPDRTSRVAMAAGGNTGDMVGSVQADAYTSHTHPLNNLAGDTGGTATSSGHPRGSGSQAFGINPNTFSSGSNETRPKNANVNYIIKI